MSDTQYRIKMIHLNYLHSGIIPLLTHIAVILLTVTPAIQPLVYFKFVSQVSWKGCILPGSRAWKQRAGTNLLEFLKHNLIFSPNSDIPVWPMPDEITFYYCRVIILVECTPELFFPTTSSNFGVCFPKASVRLCPGCRASAQRGFLAKRGLCACHGSEKRIGIGTFRAEV